MKYIFYIVLCYLCPISLIGQNYFPFPESNATWHVVIHHKEGNNYFSYKIEGDTLINSLKYSKIYDYNYNIAPNRYIGAIREDSMKRIYFYGNLNFTNNNNVEDTVREYLLYQFGLNVGDSIPAFKLKPSEPSRYILSIDSIKVDGEFRLRYNVSNPNITEDYWIEGIGSEAGLFGPYSHEFEIHIRLYCFQQNGKYVWPDTTSGCLTVSVLDIKNESELKVYPNPTQNILHIKSTSQIHQVQNIQIIDLNGKNIIHSKQSPINTSELSPGIYFFQVEMSSSEVVRGKFVKK